MKAGKKQIMKEYLIMLLVFTGLIFLFKWFIGSLLVAWLIVGRAALAKKGVDLSGDGLASYWFYFAWPYYINKYDNL